MPDEGKGRAKGQRPRRASGGRTEFAAVDLGTNKCRLLVAERRPNGFRTVDSHSEAVRLGQGLAHDGRISDAAIERAMSALGKIRAKLKSRGVTNIRCVATQACRAAANGRDFIQRVQADHGLSFKVITPKEEARLSVIGCHDLFAPEADLVLVVDIGGGSTELCWVDVGQVRSSGLTGLLSRVPVIDWVSFPLGVVTLTEAFDGLPEVDRFEAMLQKSRETLNAYAKREGLARRMASTPCHMIGTSGTVTSLAALHLGLDRYIRSTVDGSWMNRDQAGEATRRLVEVGLEGRKRLPCIGQDRSELIMAGCAILEAVFETFPAERIRVADRGLREGLLLSMMHGPKSGAQRSRRRKRRRAGGAGSAAQSEGGGA